MATAQEIRDWFAANPGASDTQIAQAMQANNVSSGDVASALGVDPVMVAQRYAAATAPAPVAAPAPAPAPAPAATTSAAQQLAALTTPETWVPGASTGLLNARKAGQNDQQYYGAVALAANKWLANPGTAAEAFDAMVKSGISVSDLLNAGISQSTIDNAFTAPSEAAQKQVNTAALNSMTSMLAQNPLVATEISKRGIEDVYAQARKYVSALQQGGLTEAELNQLREAATAQSWGYADIRAAGIDPTLLFGAPKSVVPPPVVPPPVVPRPVVPVFQPPTPYTPVTVYDPNKFAQEQGGADLYAKGVPALDVAFRESPVRTVSPVTGQYMYTPAAKLRPATGAGWSWTPPVVTSRPRQLLDVGPTASASQLYAQGRSAQDRALRNAFASRNLPMSAANTYYWQSRLRGGDYSPGGVFDPNAFQADFDTWSANLPPTGGGPATGSTTEQLQPQMFLNMQPQMFAEGGDVTASRKMLERIALGDYVTKKAEGGPVEVPPEVPSRSTSADQYEDVFKDIPLLSRIGEYAGGLFDKLKYGIGETSNHAYYNNALRSRLREIYPELKTDTQDNGLLDAAVKYAGAYDWAVRPNVEPEDARSMAHAYQLYDYNRENRNPQDEVSDYVRNMAGVEAGIKDRAEGRRLSDEDLFRTALEYAVSQTGGTMPLGKVDLWLREARKAIPPAAEESPVKKKDGGEVTARNLPRERMNARRARAGMEPFVPQAPTKTAGQAAADMLSGISMATTPLPIAGDIAGLAADAAMYAAYPEERTLANYGLTALGALPFVPAPSVIRLAKNGASAANNAANELRQIFAENPLNARELITGGAAATVYPVRNSLRLSDIRTFDPGKGNASEMLRSILKVADENNVPVTLTAKNYRGSGLTTEQLVEWYKRNGFEVQDGLGEDGVDMIRMPRQSQEVPGIARQMLNEGTPAIRQADTPEFKKWFGESKVVDESGQPLRVYHATTRDFPQFKLSKEGSLGSGIYTTPDTEFANTYAQAEGGNVMPLYVSMKKPLILGMDNAGRQDPMIEALKKLGMDEAKAETLVEKAYEEKGYIGKQVQTRATAQGYDGIMQYRNGKLMEVVPFYSTQLKSAIGNEGTFDPANPVITKKDGGEVSTEELLAQMDRIGAGPAQDDSRGAYDLLVEAERRAAKKPERARTESRGLLDRLNASMLENVTEPVAGSLVDMTVGLGDLGQMATKYMAGRTRGPLAQRFLGADPRTGIPTEPFTPLAPRVREALGLSGYDPSHPVAIGTQIALPALRTATTVGRAANAANLANMATRAPRPGSAQELAQRIGGEMAAETQRYAEAELGATIARDVAPGNTAAELLASVAGSTAINTAQSLDPRDLSRVMSGMTEIYRHLPTPETPFVGRLDKFIANLDVGRISVDELLARMRGKFRGSEILRVERAFADADKSAKLTSSELLEKLQGSYNPSDLNVVTLSSNQIGQFYPSMDNPWVKENNLGDPVPPQGVVILRQGGRADVFSPEDSLRAEQAQKGKATWEYLREKYYLSETAPDSDYTVELMTSPTKLSHLSSTLRSAFDGRTDDTAGFVNSTLDYIEAAVSSRNNRTEALAMIGSKAGEVNQGLFNDTVNRLLQQGGVPGKKLQQTAYVEAFKRGYEWLIDSTAAEYAAGILDLPRPDSSVTTPGQVTEFIQRTLRPAINNVMSETGSQVRKRISDQLARLATTQEVPKALDNLIARYKHTKIAVAVNPDYRGQHPSLSPNLKDLKKADLNDIVSFSRTSDVTANNVNGMPTARGIYVHELQSDLMDDIRKHQAGVPRGATQQEIEALRNTTKEQYTRLIKQIDELKQEHNQLSAVIPTELSDERRQVVDKIRELNDKIYKLSDKAKEAQKRERFIQNVSNRDRSTDLEEPFAGMATDSKSTQIMMIKAAVASALNKGFNFVALPSQKYSAQPQLYERLPQNAREVVKDLGEGFTLEQINLSNRDGEFPVLAITWNKSTSEGSNGVSRVLTQGIPFKDGGEVTTDAEAVKKLLSYLNK